MSVVQIIILAAIQGLAELLPVSSSAHVILAQKLMGIDPSSPTMTFFLVMLHTGTMFAVLLFFWSRWKKMLINLKTSRLFLKAIVIATIVTGILGLSLKIFIEKVILETMLGHSKGEVENLFKVLPLVSAALFFVGLYIIYSGLKKNKKLKENISSRDALFIGLTQGLSLPFRGFSRSGSTISTSLLLGFTRELAEEFSFALAVVLTPPVIVLELRRLMKSELPLHLDYVSLLKPGLIGMVFSFLFGLLALKWLASWLEKGKWHYFGYYCVVLSIVAFVSSFI
ncbi:MAG: undecaprenyl-diphosphate phosphatase [Bacteriovorax sp.]|nr:undecaprenyl-diphosphate phosphatase [Bacteriovorax sp.]